MGEARAGGAGAEPLRQYFLYELEVGLLVLVAGRVFTGVRGCALNPHPRIGGATGAAMPWLPVGAACKAWAPAWG